MTDLSSPRPLAILVVYLARSDEDLELVMLHLERIRRHTHRPYVIYAAVNRTTPEARAVLEARPEVVCCAIAPTELRLSREHAYYLDALMERAFDDGAETVVTLDVDAFPVRDDWYDAMELAAPPESGICGVWRAENDDTELVHPSAMLLRRAFVDRYQPTFSPDTDGSPDFRRFLRRSGQAGDTGIRIAYILWRDQLPWGRLARSNRRDLHFLIGGIYGDVVFHLGAGSRKNLFRHDVRRSRIHRLTRPIERIPTPAGFATTMKRRVLSRLRDAAEAEMITRNTTAAARIREWLLRDSDGLLAYLRGAPRHDLAVPDWVDEPGSGPPPP